MLPLHCQEQIVFYAVHAGYDGLCKCVCKDWKRWASEIVENDQNMLRQRIHELSLREHNYGKMFDSHTSLAELQWEYQKLKWKIEDEQDERARQEQKETEKFLIQFGLLVALGIGVFSNLKRKQVNE